MTRPVEVQAAIARMQVYLAAEGLAEDADNLMEYIESLERPVVESYDRSFVKEILEQATPPSTNTKQGE